VEGGLQKWSISLYGRSVRGTWRHKRKALEMGTSFHGGLTGKPGRGFICQGLVWKKVLGWVSLHIGSSLGNLRRGGDPSTVNFEN